jgi:hypothetical protein
MRPVLFIIISRGGGLIYAIMCMLFGLLLSWIAHFFIHIFFAKVHVEANLTFILGGLSMILLGLSNINSREIEVKATIWFIPIAFHGAILFFFGFFIPVFNQ